MLGLDLQMVVIQVVLGSPKLRLLWFLFVVGWMLDDGLIFGCFIDGVCLTYVVDMLSIV